MICLTLDHLVATFPDVRFEIANGAKKIARVSVTYHFQGTLDEYVRFISVLENEWAFATQHCTEKTVHMEYLVKPDEVERFLQSVQYRGKKVVSGF